MNAKLESVSPSPPNVGDQKFFVVFTNDDCPGAIETKSFVFLFPEGIPVNSGIEIALRDSRFCFFAAVLFENGLGSLEAVVFSKQICRYVSRKCQGGEYSPSRLIVDLQKQCPFSR